MKDFLTDTNNAIPSIPYPGPIPQQKDPYGLISLHNILTPTDMAEVLEKVARVHTKRIACCMCDDTCKRFPQEPPNPRYRTGPRRNDVSLLACFFRAAKMANERQKAVSVRIRTCSELDGAAGVKTYPCACGKLFSPYNTPSLKIPPDPERKPWSEWAPGVVASCKSETDAIRPALTDEEWDNQLSKCITDAHEEFLKYLEDNISCNDTIKIYEEAIKTCRGQYGPPTGKEFATEDF